MARATIPAYDPAANNNTEVNGVSIAEGMSPASVNDAMREIMAALKRWDVGTDPMTSPAITVVNEALGTSIASASTINLTTATGGYLHVTGTVAITAVTLAAGAGRVVVFESILTLTNGASLLLPGGANITTAAGDVAGFRGDAAGVVKCVAYLRANGTPVVNIPGEMTRAAPVASAGTVNLDTQTPSDFVHITGTTTITAITLADGRARTVVFDGILTLTNGASLILPTGASIVTAAGDSCIIRVEAAGDVCVVHYQRASGQALTASAVIGIQGGFKNLTVTGNAGLATATVVADEVMLETTGNAYTVARSVSLTINSATGGANGLDTGTVAATTWYSVWVIYNGTTVAGLMSLSATAPTMPGGYTYKASVGWIRTSGTASQFVGTLQIGRRGQWIVDGTGVAGLPQIAAGSGGSVALPTYVATAWAAFAPPTTGQIDYVLSGTSSANGEAIIAPNANYTGAASTVNPPPGKLWSMTNSGGSMRISLLQESANVYLATNSNARIYVSGWEDNL